MCIDQPVFLTRSEKFMAALEDIERYAKHDYAPVLLEGESGTGKTYLAYHLHLRSNRSAKPFHQVILSTLDDALATSDLFGHVPGAFTGAVQRRIGHFAVADGGTLFLDEIGKASRAMQQRLLHAVERRRITPVGADREVSVNVRICAATNISISELVDRNEFLHDLAARFGYSRVVVPALRDRREDIPLLVRQFVANRAGECGYRKAPEIDDELMDILVRAPWPGNLRELDAAIVALLMRANDSSLVTIDHCGPELGVISEMVKNNHRKVFANDPERLVKEIGSISAAAKKLGIGRGTLRRRIQEQQSMRHHECNGAGLDQ